MHKGKLLAVTAIIAASALVGLLSSTDTVRATTFAPYYSTFVNDRSAGASGNVTTLFGFDVTTTTTESNFALAVTFLPPDLTITPSSSLNVGDIVGQTFVSPTTLGITNAPCNQTFPVPFTFRVASTDVRDTILPMPEGVFNRLGNLRMDLRGATPGSNSDGLPDFLNAWPAFLNKVFDPDDSAVSGVSPTFPLKPIARYAAGSNIGGTDIILQFLVFGKGALIQFQNTGASHPFPQFTEDWGYPTVTILQDPTASAAPSNITDFCAPFTSTTALSGITNPEVAKIINQCADNVDSDFVADGVVNDGCPKIGISESTIAGACANDIDDLEDTPPDGAVNDGCDAFGGAEDPAFKGIDCADPANNDGDSSTTTSVFNDGCPVDGSVGEHNMCENSTDDDDNDLGTGGFQPDAFINDGCPAVGAAETAGAQCADVLDNDNDGFVNDGCVQENAGHPGNTEASGCGVGDQDDDDGDGEVNDGCPTVPEGETAITTNPPAGTGMFKTNTHLTTTFYLSIRDADNDDLENTLDTCPFITNLDNPRTTSGLDTIGTTQTGDNIDDACDAAPGGDGSAMNTMCGPGSDDDANGSGLGTGFDGFDCDLDDFFNTLDNCPQIANPGQVESERNVPYDTATDGDGGSRTDGIGDPCDTNKTVANGHYHAQWNVDATCYFPGVDADGDGWCDDTETILGSDPGIGEQGVGEAGFSVDPAGFVTDLCNDGNTDNDGDSLADAADAGCSTPEHVAVDYQLPISNPGALRLAAGSSQEGDGSTSGGQCASSASFVGVDDDGDGVVNDGCVAVSVAENPQCAAAENTSDDSGEDSVVNDGCPTNVFAEDDPENPCTGGTGDCGTAAACSNSIDDDNDPFINDGCPQVGVISEDQGQCSDDGDDDGDNNANDGCPIVNNGVPQTCSDGIDNDRDGTIDQLDPGCAAALTPDVDADGVCNSGAAVVGKCILPPEAGAECRGAADDETDGVVNDGCRALTTTAGTAETVAQCRGNADDDDGGGGPVNDGCGALTTTGGTKETVGTQCNNADDDDGDGAVNDGCDQQGARAEVGLQCNNATDDDVADSDGFVNDGCPALTTTGGTAETAAQCNNAVDDDSDGFVNDGCPALTFTGGTAETVGTQCNNADDDDGDGFVNDGCAATGVDNCPTQRNPNQTNTDAALNAAGAGVDIKGLTNFTDLPGDSLGNACDPDDDNDSFTGDHIVLTGGVRNGVCRSTGLGGPVSRPVFDDCVENYLGTDPQDNCPDNASGEPGLADALDDDAWPVDINRGGGSFDKVNTGDTLAGGFGGMQTAQNLRSDFNTDLSVNLFDFFLLIQLGDLGDGFFLRSCR